MPSQQPDETSTIPENLSSLLSIVKEKDDSFILLVYADQSVFGLPSYEIIVTKENVEFITNFNNIMTA